MPKTMNLRLAWMALASQVDRLTDDKRERAALQYVLNAARDLVNYYDEAELADNPDKSSGSDDASALYEILNRGGMPVC